jgi:hypothetical protein
MPTLMTLHITFLFTRWNVDRYDVKLVHQNLFLWRFCIAVVIFSVVWQPLLGPERVSWPPRFVPAWIVASCLRCSVNWREAFPVHKVIKGGHTHLEVIPRVHPNGNLGRSTRSPLGVHTLRRLFTMLPATCGNLWTSQLAGICGLHTLLNLKMNVVTLAVCQSACPLKHHTFSF